ncbi:MAG: hypothetical protein JWN90_533 [Parcubacteria group bacterium]|nr:hypothetical protein [Parcubacteria group bacterium]
MRVELQAIQRIAVEVPHDDTRTPTRSEIRRFVQEHLGHPRHIVVVEACHIAARLHAVSPFATEQRHIVVVNREFTRDTPSDIASSGRRTERHLRLELQLHVVDLICQAFVVAVPVRALLVGMVLGLAFVVPVPTRTLQRVGPEQRCAHALVRLLDVRLDGIALLLDRRGWRRATMGERPVVADEGHVDVVDDTVVGECPDFRLNTGNKAAADVYEPDDDVDVIMVCAVHEVESHTIGERDRLVRPVHDRPFGILEDHLERAVLGARRQTASGDHMIERDRKLFHGLRFGLLGGLALHAHERRAAQVTPRERICGRARIGRRRGDFRLRDAGLRCPTHEGYRGECGGEILHVSSPQYGKVLVCHFRRTGRL